MPPFLYHHGSFTQAAWGNSICACLFHHQASISDSCCSAIWLQPAVVSVELNSTELVYRYLDMIVTDGVKETFRKRSKVMSTIRNMLEQQDFLEVETPVLESTAGRPICHIAAKPVVTAGWCNSTPLLLQLQMHLYSCNNCTFTRVTATAPLLL